MAIPMSTLRHPFWLLLGAVAALAGSGILLELGGSAEGVASVSGSAGPPELGLLALVILLALAGVVLAAMAAKEYRDSKRQEHVG
ncbi:MAG TPA: hypothetical protein VFP50_19450 [Anaeromyxobacteraceae bacterium]|nr:hypothetical protein [Anaeromyxobacteraceae bacterium]